MAAIVFVKKEVRAMFERIDSVDELFVHQLQDLFSAENQLIPALTRMASAADGADLRAEFAHHLERTQAHVARLEKALDIMDLTPSGEPCHGIEGLVAEGERLIATTSSGPVLDNVLIDSARKVEQYEISAYRGTLTKAYELGFVEVAALLELNLQEEELADYRLQQLAQGMMPYSGPGLDPRDDGSEVILGQSRG
jgi:ferritin-like metal-binding protein YciE